MTTLPKLRLAIVGSGIGGLSFAVALSKLGLTDVLEINIYEAATKLAQVGAGITIWPRAWDILIKLGLEKVLSERSPPCEAALRGEPVIGFSYRKSDQRPGTSIVDVKLPGGPRAFHRADIQDVLIEHTSSSIRFHFSYRLKEYTNTSNGIELMFLNGRKATCDILVGADGINSIVRQIFVANGGAGSQHSRPSWTGTIVYRSLINAELIRKEAPDHPGLRSSVVYCGKSKHIVMYPILQGRYINTIQFISDPSKEGTSLSGPAVLGVTDDDVASLYTGWEDDVQCVVKHINRPSRWAIQTVGPLERYASECIFLVGDAAHAMAPHLGNGAAQAIEDAYILASLLDKALHRGHWDILRVTDAYNSVRQPFGNFVVNATKHQGLRYELNISGFENTKEGDVVSPCKLTELGRLIEKGWEWTWKTSVNDDLEKALAMLSGSRMSCHKL